MIFSCAVSAVYYNLGLRLIKPKTKACDRVDLTRFPERIRKLSVIELGNFGVFGDDIVVLKEAYRETVRLLNLLGFQVNEQKSFSEGPFRESCGGDYFNGHQVRGVYLKSLATPASRYVAINRLNAWTAMSGIPLRKTIRRLVKKVRWLPVPLYENDDAGIKVPLDVALYSISTDSDVQSIKYRRWAAEPKSMKLRDGYITVPKGAKGRVYNPDGLLITALRGDIDNDKLRASARINIRLGVPVYRTKWAISPNWDWLPEHAEETYSVLSWQFATAIRFNLT
jgi:hypothetical protein